jgi:hypothetical protein
MATSSSTGTEYEEYTIDTTESLVSSYVDSLLTDMLDSRSMSTSFTLFSGFFDLKSLDYVGLWP